MTGNDVILPANGWEPRPYQRGAWAAMMNPDIRTVVLAWHRRAGKDEIALHAIAIRAMQRPGVYFYCLPQYNQARKAIWEAVNPKTGRVRWKDAIPDELISKTDNQSMTLKLVNGSIIYLVGSDNPDSLVGTPPVGIIYSEAALSNPTAHALLRPILLENNGWSMHISSTRGKNHFYNTYQTALGLDDSYASHLSAEDTDVFTKQQLLVEKAIYLKQWGRAMGTSLFDQEYLSQWDAAVVGAVFGEEIRDMERSGRVTPLSYDKRFPVDTSWDLGVGDPTVILFWQQVGNMYRLFDWYSATDTGLDHYAKVLKQKGYLYRNHYGPHDIDVREWGANGISRRTQARRLGINFTVTPKLPKDTSISLGSALVDRMFLNADDVEPEQPEADCHFVLNALKNYHFPYDKERKVVGKKPVHDWSSHYADAFMTMAAHAGTDVAVTAAANADVVIGQDQQLNDTRLRDILARTAHRQRGAWG